MAVIYPLEIHDLTVAYHKKPVLYGVDMQIPEGVIVGLMGPNGAGKSTLIKAVMGILRPVGGWVKVFNKPYAKAIKRVAYVPQRESVDWDFPVNVYDVVMMGRYGHLGPFRWPSREDKATVMEALEKVGMDGLADRQIGDLSGGQQQRVFLARALVQESDLYLMDEPFVGVDASTEAAIVSIMKTLKDAGKTLVVVHHDLTTAKSYFDMLALLNMRLVAFGSVNDVFKPDLLQKAYGGRLSILSDVAAMEANLE